VADTRVADPGLKIRDPHAVRPAGELAIQTATPVERPAAPETAGRIDQALLARQIRSRFAALGECPVEVARHHPMARASAAAGRFTLRWTILRSGRVADTAVVADSPVNDRVMDCVKRQMNTWSFTPPEGGIVRLERPFRFKGR
jgi:outer membrane biosynthesis protein TonB